jgi:hypothetical protein
MLHACVQRFDVTENLKILAKFLASKRCPSWNGAAALTRIHTGQWAINEPFPLATSRWDGRWMHPSSNNGSDWVCSMQQPAGYIYTPSVPKCLSLQNRVSLKDTFPGDKQKGTEYVWRNVAVQELGSICVWRLWSIDRAKSDAIHCQLGNHLYMCYIFFLKLYMCYILKQAMRRLGPCVIQ